MASKKEEIPVDDFLRSAVNAYLIPFCLAVDPVYQVNWHLEEIAAKLEKALEDLVERDISTNIIIEMPPRHGKSDIATQKFPAWVLGKFPDLPIIVTSYASDLAEGFGLKTRDLLELDEYQAHFDTRLRSDVKARARWLTLKRGPEVDGEFEMVPALGSYTAVGIGGTITGRGYKIGIIDDPHKNRQEADSDLMRENVWNWYKSTFRTRQEGSAIKIIIMQRWHMKDLVGMVLQQERDDLAAGEKEIDRWEVIRFPAIAEHDEQYRKKGEALWPWKFDLSKLKKTKAALGPYDWEALYQQNPIPSEKQEFKEEWIQYYEPHELVGKTLDTKATVDLAIGEKQIHDETSVVPVSKEREQPYWYVRPTETGHFDPGVTIDKIFETVKLYRSPIGLESVQYQKALKYFILDRQRKDEFYFDVYELKKNQDTSKEVRIRGLIPLMKAGVIKFLRGTHEKLVRQMLAFPQGEHDDELDALASHLEMWNTTAYEEQEGRKTSAPEPVRVSEMQGTLTPTDTREEQHDGVLDDVDIGTMQPKQK